MFDLTLEIKAVATKRRQQSDKIVLVSGLVQSPRQCRKFFGTISTGNLISLSPK